jgi:hypothetical protein
MANSILSVILYKPIHPRTLELKNALSNATLLKVFIAQDLEEVQQIVHMSDKSCLVFDKMEETKIHIRAGINPARGHYRRYFMDWDRPLVGRLMLSLSADFNLTIMTCEKMEYAIEKFELYLFGLINVYSKKEFIEPSFTKDSFGKAFFTHLQYSNHEWKMTISTHEKEKNISNIIVKDWEQLMKGILAQTGQYRTPIEEVMPRTFMQVIYPHLVEGYARRLSILHVPHDTTTISNIGKFYKFLEKI